MSAATAEQLAKLFDVTPAKIRDLTQSGVLTQKEGKYPLPKTITDYVRHLQAVIKSAGGNEKTASLETQRLEAEVRIKKAKAAQEEARLRQIRSGLPQPELPEKTPPDDLMTAAEIAKAEGVSRQAVYKQINRYGLTPSEGSRYSLTAYRACRVRADTSKTLEEAKRDDILAATRLKRLRIAEAEGRLISRDLAVDLLASLSQSYLSSIENVLETKDDQAAAKAQLRADYAAILKRLPRLLARLDAAHPIEGTAED